LRIGHICPSLLGLKPADLMRRLNRLARLRGWEIKAAEGGNHTKVTLNGRRTTIGRHTADLKTGTFRAILKQLGLTDTDLEV
jgi:predicted RNA binding protein YcfA (HicA-like mRNA interferase family)